jgi:hypothetical protein
MAFQSHDSCQSYWIIDQGQMKGINLYFTIFLDIFPINYTTLELTTYLEEVLGNTKYHHQDRDIPNARFMSVLLDNGSRTNERDPSIFYNHSRDFVHKLHYFRVGHLPRRGIRNHEVSSPGPWHSEHKIHVSPFGSWLKDK